MSARTRTLRVAWQELVLHMQQLQEKEEQEEARVRKLKEEAEACVPFYPPSAWSSSGCCFKLLFIPRGTYNTDAKAFAAIHEAYMRENKQPLLCVFVECACSPDTLEELEAAFRAYFTEYHQLPYRISLVYMSFGQDLHLRVSPVQCLLAL